MRKVGGDPETDVKVPLDEAIFGSGSAPLPDGSKTGFIPDPEPGGMAIIGLTEGPELWNASVSVDGAPQPLDVIEAEATEGSGEGGMELEPSPAGNAAVTTNSE